MKLSHYLVLWTVFFTGSIASGQKTVSQQTMLRVFEEVKTPCKYGLVVIPAHDHNKIDSPTVFRDNGKWYMTYVLYDGKSTEDGRGYETWLAVSDDLLCWRTLGRILTLSGGGWDSSQRGGYVTLIDNRWDGSSRPQKYDGRYWISYIGGNASGYEAGTLNVGMAWTDRAVSDVHEWNCLERPVMTPHDSDAGTWEAYTLYKSGVIRDPSRLLGAPFVMYYNAKGSEDGKESIGIALSDNLTSWRRYMDNPVLQHGEGITGDAQVVQMGNLYVMFYFGAFWKDRMALAFNRFACSYDLAHWTDWTGDDLVAPSEPYDNMFAHKSWVLKYKGIVYHFYCAVNDKDQRGIALAVSKDLGCSPLHFE